MQIGQLIPDNDYPCFLFVILIFPSIVVAGIALLLRILFLLFSFAIQRDVLTVEHTRHAAAPAAAAAASPRATNALGLALDDADGGSGTADGIAPPAAPARNYRKGSHYSLADFRGSWFTRHRWLISKRFLTRAVAALLLVYAIPFVALMPQADVPNAW